MRQSTLCEAMGLEPGGILACVGAGGKTTVCLRAWHELRYDNPLALFSTTTHIWEPHLPEAAVLVLAQRPIADRIQRLAIHHHGLILAGSRLPGPVDSLNPNPAAPARPVKLAGLSLEAIEGLIDNLDGATWLVEADGARGRDLKWPAAHEPVIPRQATAVAVLACLDAIGRPLDEATVHRSEEFAAALGLALGSPLSAEHVAQVLVEPRGGRKHIPAGARVMAILNQSDPAHLHPHAGQVIDRVLASGRMERVVVASLRAESPVLGVYSP